MEHKLKKTDDCYSCENCLVASGDGDGIYFFAGGKRPCIGQKLGFTSYDMADSGDMAGTVYLFQVELKDGKAVAIGGGKEFDIEQLMSEKAASVVEEPTK
jgi:hypothetical protein